MLLRLTYCLFLISMNLAVLELETLDRPSPLSFTPKLPYSCVLERFLTPASMKMASLTLVGTERIFCLLNDRMNQTLAQWH